MKNVRESQNIRRAVILTISIETLMYFLRGKFVRFDEKVEKENTLRKNKYRGGT